ncbi:hypothetical protein DZA50_00775 [Kangiella sp. HD9-110m-PIT-SAG07]|nr:hypothetical protein DZA50_00775 [Kangiella sp. HD9-110m-PIT-SAG07]
MNKQYCVTHEGEHFVILQNNDGTYLCPVCGSPEFDEPPYDRNGQASFQICSCGFEFGFDDSALASKDAIEGIASNWDRWRLKVVEMKKHSRESLLQLETNRE